MFDKLLSTIAPHLCFSCGKTGSVLCDNCKYNIVSESYSGCLACGRIAGSTGVCSNCQLPYIRAWCAGEREGVLQRIIGAYKFQNNYAAHQLLADILVERIGRLPTDTIIVPVPTVVSHIRERGYDHTLLLAKRMAHQLGVTYRTSLQRNGNAKQREASRAVRKQQAKQAFYVDGSVPPVPHLLIDDIVTTGATVHYGALALKNAGASEVWVATIARQPLD